MGFFTAVPTLASANLIVFPPELSEGDFSAFYELLGEEAA